MRMRTAFSRGKHANLPKSPRPLRAVNPPTHKVDYWLRDVNLKTAPGLVTQLLEISLAEGTNRPVMVQSCDCANLSAGFISLSHGGGPSIPATGEWRICAQFIASAGAA